MAYNPKLVQQLGAAAEGVIATSLAPGVDDSDAVKTYVARWTKEVGREPNGLPYTQYLYDAPYLIAAVLKSLPFSDKQDFDDAQKGLLRKPDTLTIKDANGKVVWDLNGLAAEDWDKLPRDYRRTGDPRWDAYAPRSGSTQPQR